MYVVLTGCVRKDKFLKRVEADFGACQAGLRGLLALSFHHVRSGKWTPGPRAYMAAKSGWQVNVSLREALQGKKAARAGFNREARLGDIQERVCALLGRAPGSVALIVCGKLYEHPLDLPFESCPARTEALVVVAQTSADEFPRALVCDA